VAPSTATQGECGDACDRQECSPWEDCERPESISLCGCNFIIIARHLPVPAGLVELVEDEKGEDDLELSAYTGKRIAYMTLLAYRD